MSMRKMQAEIVTVGNELLNGRTENTNASFLSRELQNIGFSVTNHTTVADRASDIVQSLMTAVNRSNVIVYTGGLGPTDDDLTKETVAKALGMTLNEDAETLERIRVFFESRRREMKDNNRKQALVPEGAEILENDNGTAPGIFIRKDEQTIILLPGPPHEMEPMFLDKAVPKLKELSGQKIFSRTLGVSGIGESELEVRIKDYLYGDDPHAALYAKEGEVEICVTSFGDTDEEAEEKGTALISKLKNELGDLVFTENGDTIAEATVKKLIEKKQTVAVAESCTGGMIAQMITDIAGSSAVFEYGLTSYGDWVKNASLGVDNSLLKKYTAISSAVAAEMARGARKNGRASYGIGVTGIAGPGVGTYLDKEVGLVYIAVCDRKKTVVREFRFGDKRNRDNIRRLSAKNAFDMLRLFMDGRTIEGGTEFTNRVIADLERKDNPKSIAGLFVKKADPLILQDLDKETQQALLEYLRECPLYEAITVGDKDYFLVHSGFENFREDRKISDYSADELLWARPKIDTVYYEDVHTILGHTPAKFYGIGFDGHILKTRTWTNIDCGAGHGTEPVLLRLEDFKEFSLA